MTIESKIHHVEINRPPKIFALKKDDIFSYILKKYDDTGEPTYSNELAEYFKLSVKRINGYLENLEAEGFLKRPKENCPQPNFPTSEGRDEFYKKIINLFPRCRRPQIQGILAINLDNHG